MSNLYFYLNNPRKVIEYNLKTLKIKLPMQYEHHPDLQPIYHSCSLAYSQEGSHKEALKMHQKSLNISLKKYGNDHPDGANSMIHLCRMYQRLGDYEAGFTCAKKAFFILAAFHQIAHPDVTEALQEFFNCYDKIALIDLNRSLDEIQPHVIKLFGEQHQFMQKFQT